MREPYDPFLDINQQFGELELHPFHDPARRMASQRHQTIAPERYNPRRDLLLPHIQIEEMLGEGLFVVHKVVGGQGANDYEWGVLDLYAAAQGRVLAVCDGHIWGLGARAGQQRQKGDYRVRQVIAEQHRLVLQGVHEHGGLVVVEAARYQQLIRFQE